jgi:hypothetical protein
MYCHLHTANSGYFSWLVVFLTLEWRQKFYRTHVFSVPYFYKIWSKSFIFRSFLSNHELIRIQIQNDFDSIFYSVKNATKIGVIFHCAAHFTFFHCNSRWLYTKYIDTKFICLLFFCCCCTSKKKRGQIVSSFFNNNKN